ncbi:MAG: 30S ribosomal protein S1 [Terriglobia bacterium]|jgi:small subunit ribosomal protein S1
MSADEKGSSLQTAGIESLQEVGTDLEAQNDLTDSQAKNPEISEVANLMEGMEALSTPTIAAGEIVQGHVLKITDTEVVVDVGLKCEAQVPRSEFLALDGHLRISPGDTVDLWVDNYDEPSGTVSVSYQRALRRKTWDGVERAFQDQTNITCRVVDRIKGGLMVDIGVPAFLPASHADVRVHANLDELKGQEFPCKVIKVNRKKNNVVVSRKAAIEEELNRRKQELAERLLEGAEVVGKVKNLTDYGVFVDLGGIDGLLHITDLSWGRIGHPSEVVQVGQELSVKVLKHDPERGRISLGLKQLTPDPWEQVAATYHAGDRISGRVVSLADYGAFIELEAGVEGLIHISEMSWSKRLRHPSKILKLDERVEVGVLDVDPVKRRISLSLKSTLPDPWTFVGERFAVGSMVHGRVRNLTEFGAFVEIEDGVDGLIHISNMSWNKNLKHPSEVLKKGQTVDAVVLAVDPDNRRLALGLKQLEEDPREAFFSRVHVGDMLRGKVTRVAPFGAFVELAEGIEGLCHVSEFENGHARNEGAKLEVGSDLEFRVIRLSARERKIALSQREAVVQPAPAEIEKPKEPVRQSTMAEALSSAGINALEYSSSPSAVES